MRWASSEPKQSWPARAARASHELPIDAGRAERRVVVLARQREGIGHAGVAGAEDDEEVGIAALGEVAIGPRVGGTAAVEVDVGRDEPADSTALEIAHRSRPCGEVKKPSMRRAQLSGVVGIGAARVAGRTAGRAEERVVDRSTAAGEGRAVEKAVRVELADELLETGPGDLLAVALAAARPGSR